VNIAGNRGDQWDGPDPRSFTAETLDMIVESVREIIDAVAPSRTVYCLETMPWMVPDSAVSALEIVHAVDRKAFGIHFDPVNLINCPRRYYDSGAMVDEFVKKVGKHIVAVHLKDISLGGRLTMHLDEVRPGLGGFDIGRLLKAVDSGLSADMPVMLEHLSTEEEYSAAASHVRSVGASLGIAV
jgi:sugar phosphate isomerase/epimerase